MLQQAISLVVLFFAIQLKAQSVLPVPEIGKCADSPVISDFDPAKVNTLRLQKSHKFQSAYHLNCLSMLAHGLK